MPEGELSCPSFFPYEPHFVTKVPLFVNSLISALYVSATNTFPDDGSTAIPEGAFRRSPVFPYSPHFEMKVPLLVNFLISALYVSATYTFPDDGSTAIAARTEKFPIAASSPHPPTKM